MVTPEEETLEPEIQADFSTEDEREAAEIREKEIQMKEETLSEDQELYRRDFFAMLEDVMAIFPGEDVGERVKSCLVKSV